MIDTVIRYTFIRLQEKHRVMSIQVNRNSETKAITPTGILCYIKLKKVWQFLKQNIAYNQLIFIVSGCHLNSLAMSIVEIPSTILKINITIIKSTVKFQLFSTLKDCLHLYMFKIHLSYLSKDYLLQSFLRFCFLY